MKSKIYKINGKLFRYDFDCSIVEYVVKASKEEIEEDKCWKEKYGHSLYGIDETGYTVLDSVGLHKDNWTNKASRNEYLEMWAEELKEEERYMIEDFVKYELPYIK